MKKLKILLGICFVLILSPIISAQENVQNLIVNGSFEQGFQPEYGIGFGWGAFSNGAAVVSWSAETWDKAVVGGRNAQSIQIQNAGEENRYAGVYQVVNVVPNQDYNLTLNGILRTSDGNEEKSSYGYKVTYAFDFNGGTDWQAIPNDQWLGLDWTEQSIEQARPNKYRVDKFQTKVTPTSDSLTIFVRLQKKWVDKSSGILTLDEITLVGPATSSSQQQAVTASSTTDTDKEDEAEKSEKVEETEAVSTKADETSTSAQAQAVTLPVSGKGYDESMAYVFSLGIVFVLVLISGAFITMMRRDMSQ